MHEAVENLKMDFSTAFFVEVVYEAIRSIFQPRFGCFLQISEQIITRRNRNKTCRNQQLTTNFQIVYWFFPIILIKSQMF